MPSVQRSTAAARPLRSPAAFGGGLSVAVTAARPVTVTGQGAGETSGPAVAFTLVLTNGTKGGVDLTSALVSAEYGDALPASPSTGSPAKAWPASVGAGRQAQGTFVFLVPTGERRQVRLTVSYAADRPVVVLTGPVAS